MFCHKKIVVILITGWIHKPRMGYMHGKDVSLCMAGIAIMRDEIISTKNGFKEHMPEANHRNQFHMKVVNF